MYNSDFADLPFRSLAHLPKINSCNHRIKYIINIPMRLPLSPSRCISDHDQDSNLEAFYCVGFNMLWSNSTLQQWISRGSRTRTDTSVLPITGSFQDYCLTQLGLYLQIIYLAEAIGFEPMGRSRDLRFSRPVQSTTLPNLQIFIYYFLRSLLIQDGAYLNRINGFRN